MQTNDVNAMAQVGNNKSWVCVSCTGRATIY